MSRSIKKGIFVEPSLMKKVTRFRSGVFSAGQAGKAIIKTWSRSSTIIPEMVGLTFGVHNGRTHIPILVVEDMVGHKLGEFSPTKKFSRHGGKMQKEQEAAAKQKEIDAAKAVKVEPEKK